MQVKSAKYEYSGYNNINEKGSTSNKKNQTTEGGNKYYEPMSTLIDNYEIYNKEVVRNSK